MRLPEGRAHRQQTLMTTGNQIKSDILIVGAGITGLMAAGEVRRQGGRAIVVDKGAEPGGRLATRRVGPGRADHGAQFFTVRTPEFRPWLEQWLAQGLVYRWSTGWSDGSLAQTLFNGHPRYAVQGGMNALARHLAQELDVRTNIRLEAIIPTGQEWECRAKDGQIFRAGAVLLTPPVPQSLALLEAGQTSLAGNDRAALARIAYAPCLAGLYRLDGPVHLPEPGAIQHSSAPVTWIADNRKKGISPEAVVVTVHAGPDYSRQLWDAPPDRILAALQNSLQPYLGPDTAVVETQLERWRYALPTTLHPERYLKAAGVPPLVFAGDGFNGPRVEGAALSGLAAARALAR